MQEGNSYLLSVNGGSSSIKFGLYHSGDLQVVLSGQIQGIGAGQGRFYIQDADGKPMADQVHSYAAHGEAIQALTAWLKDRASRYQLAGIGHRIVQGGPEHRSHEVISARVLGELEQLIELAPNHLPAELAIIRAFGDAFPQVTQVACYDTAFHRDMPYQASTYPIPAEMRAEGLRKYGFHGLSYEYIMHALGKEAGEKVLIAHLGNGASMAAVLGGKSIDTTMGLTPTGGLIMGTRSGDLDPGLPLHLLIQKKMSAEEVDTLLTTRSGLKALSGSTSDVRELLEKELADPLAAQALAIFCYQARKFIGALAAALGGLDTVVFTGGIGEHAPLIRKRICEGLGFIGIIIDDAANAAAADIISAATAPVQVRVIRTNEEWMIASHMQTLLQLPTKDTSAHENNRKLIH